MPDEPRRECLVIRKGQQVIGPPPPSKPDPLPPEAPRVAELRATASQQPSQREARIVLALERIASVLEKINEKVRHQL